MTEQSTIPLERTTPQIARITFANPPVNLIVGETVIAAARDRRELGDDPDIQVVVFASGVPDFFFNHFDLAAAGDFPVPEHEDAAPVWTDIVLRLTKAPYITHRVDPRPHPRRRQRARPRLRPALRQPGEGDLRPARGRRRPAPRRRRYRAAAALHRPRPGARGRSSAAPTTTPTWPNAGAGSPGPCPTRNSTPSSTRWSPAWPPSTGTSLATAKAMVNRATLPPDADLVACLRRVRALADAARLSRPRRGR